MAHFDKEFGDFVVKIWKKSDQYPRYMRIGQRIFNAIEDLYGIAYKVRDTSGIDCFYDDDKVDAFIDATWKELTA